MSAELLPEQASNGDAPRRSSHLAQLAQRRDDRLGARTLDLRVPAWEGRNGWGLVVRYRALPYATVMPLMRRAAGPTMGVSDDPEAELKAACDALISACVDMHVVTDRGEQVPLDDRAEPPFRFDARTCELLGLPEPKTAREAVVLVYGGPNELAGEYAAVGAWGEYQEFVTASTGEVEEEVLGEA
jgi:hypothetical protein